MRSYRLYVTDTWSQTCLESLHPAGPPLSSLTYWGSITPARIAKIYPAIWNIIVEVFVHILHAPDCIRLQLIQIALSGHLIQMTRQISHQNDYSHPTLSNYSTSTITFPQSDRFLTASIVLGTMIPNEFTDPRRSSALQLIVYRATG